ncbi:5-amino-6-(5-phospho-D-ribitylamino)uracil phosphatase, chloroplastic [Dendrobium catenatum]|uniref:Riboflavin kinase n=1 Tax=Dendrobium catenatum TaxID=906689 RepID=A0A2I0VM22_9ASPA|nr:5-amino-6-(5-phospho-D-ribitylamino)uracil phosphatase, chloroplastic [Dendrobium catenatum]PKU64459.1 riboflavin kinase [Dendrobium catenatum]
MVIDSIGASTSLIGCRPLYKRASSCKRRMEVCPWLTTELKGRRLICSKNLIIITNQRCAFFPSFTIKSLAMELTKEVRPVEDQLSRGLKYPGDTVLNPSWLWPPPNKADNSSLHNPLLRQERMGCGWLGVIFEWEGVIVEDDPELEKRAWLVLAQEEGKSPPPAFVLKRIEGMKNEQALSEVLCWSRDPSQLCRLAARKEEIQQNLQGGFYQIRSGSQEFVSTLMKHRIPIAVASTRPRRVLEKAMEAVGLQNSLDVIVAAEDVHRGKPDPEMFVYVAQLLNFIPERCIVVGNSNSSVEAAHDARMKCVAVASKHPLYELGAADLVVRQLDELSIVDLKNLAAVESPEFDSGEPDLELEEEDEPPASSVAVDDHFW